MCGNRCAAQRVLGTLTRMTSPAPGDTQDVPYTGPRRAMIALYPEASVAQAIALVPTMAETGAGVEFESAEDLHVTLAYYPLVTEEDRDVLLQRAARLTEYTDAPMSSVEGIGFFFSDDGVNPHVLILDPTALDSLHTQLCWGAGPVAPMPAMNHGYTPHITLAYAPDGTGVAIPHIPTMTLVFPAVSIVYDDGERHDFAFNGPGAMPVYREFRQKTAIGSHSTDTVDTAWDGAANERRLRADGNAAYYRGEYAWRDPAGDLTTKSAYKFPHHVVSADGTIGAANLAACSAGVAVLNGGRGGASIPAADKQGVYNHLAHHLSDGNRTPPALKDIEAKKPASAHVPVPPSPVGSPILPARREGRRLQGGWLKRLGDAASEIKRILAWAGYDDAELAEETDDSKMKAILSTLDASGAAFLVFKDATGADRWLAFSSNGFIDREKEIVATDALERFVALADAGTTPRGPLRLFHIDAPLADVGDCDFQAMEGRFLIESGTFRDTDIAQRALSYFRSTDDLLGVSIGFMYPKAGGFTDGVYREIQIIERSVCPHESVANPWTLFQALPNEEDTMNRVKASWLERVLGGDAAQQVITQAQDTTKALEGQVAFKATATDPADEALARALAKMKAEVNANGDAGLKAAFAALVAAIQEDEATEPAEPAKGKATTEPEPPPAPEPVPDPKEEPVPAVAEVKAAPGDDFVTAITAKVGEMLTPINEAITGLAERMKAIEADEAARKELPAAASMFRATAAQGNVVDAESAKKELNMPSEANAPVQAYVDMLKGRI